MQWHLTFSTRMGVISKLRCDWVDQLAASFQLTSISSSIIDDPSKVLHTQRKKSHWPGVSRGRTSWGGRMQIDGRKCEHISHANRVQQSPPLYEGGRLWVVTFLELLWEMMMNRDSSASAHWLLTNPDPLDDWEKKSFFSLIVLKHLFTVTLRCSTKNVDVKKEQKVCKWKCMNGNQEVALKNKIPSNRWNDSWDQSSRW